MMGIQQGADMVYIYTMDTVAWEGQVSHHHGLVNLSRMLATQGLASCLNQEG